MSQQDSGEKTEQPTPKKLSDARKKGDVAKSRDVSAAAGLLALFVLAAACTGWAADRIAGLMNAVLTAMNQPFAIAAPALAWLAFETFVAVALAVLVPVAGTAVLAEFLQAGPVFATERLSPKFENLDPIGGLKRMFSLEKVVDAGKALLKCMALAAVGWLTAASLLPALVALPWAKQPALLGTSLWSMARPILAWAAALFTMIAVLDAIHQHLRFMKKNRMTREELKREYKEMEGDPHVNAHRKQIRREWAEKDPPAAAREADALVVNPTHIAIAIRYDREQCPLPIVSAKGEDETALAMREAAEDAGVPIVRNVPLARDLLSRGDEGEPIPAELIDALAIVIAWARQVRNEMQASRETGRRPVAPRRVPGEDLTRYPGMPRRI